MNVTCYKPFELLDVSEKTTIYRMLIGGRNDLGRTGKGAKRLDTFIMRKMNLINVHL